MALHDEILIDILVGIIPRRFRVADLKKRPVAGSTSQYNVGRGTYKKNALNSIPSNHSISKDGRKRGDYVQKGRSPAFYQLGRGLYELILTSPHHIELDGSDIPETDVGPETLITTGTTDHQDGFTFAGTPSSVISLDPVKIIVDHLACVPYQRFFRKQSANYPTHPAVGWGARLDAYFWPTPSQDWSISKILVGTFCRRGAAIFGASWDPTNTTCQKLLIELFEDICAWGNVLLPESDMASLAHEIHATLPSIRSDHMPTQARVNSAWTKLYAVILPDVCVIYDTRVAASLTSILDPHMIRLAGTQLYAPFNALGHLNNAARGGTRPRQLTHSWPNGYMKWPAQIGANRLCRAVRDRLNSKTGPTYQKADNTPWTLREVEAVLFMDGY